jgi:hypothetical protein
MTVDELTQPDGSNFDDSDERSRLVNQGFTMQENAGDTDIVMTLETSEMDALTQNVRLEPYQIEPPDNIIDIAGPWRSRMFVLTSEGYVYMSSATNPSSFNSMQMVNLERYGDPLWMAKTGTGIYVGMEKDVVYLAGSGTETPDMARIDLYGEPLNLGNPPVDAAHVVYGNSIIYRSADGLMQLTGNSLEPIPFAGTSLLWRGQARHNIGPLSTANGRFRLAIDNHMLYMIAPEGTDTESAQVIYRYSLQHQQWSRLTYDQAGNLRSIFRDPTGPLLLGDDEGVVWLLEDGIQDVDSSTNDITVRLVTPIEDGGQPLILKDAFDLQLHVNTGGANAAVYIMKDGETTAADSLTASTGTPTVWRADCSDVGAFTKAQLEINGDFNTFTLNSFNLTYRPRPQRMVYLDTGYFTAPGDLVWIDEIEVDGIFTGDFTVQLYFNDTQAGSDYSVTATADKRDVYKIPIPRGTKGERPRIVVKDDDAEGTTNGFDPYYVRIHRIHSGDDTGRLDTVWPAGDAP